MLERKRSGTDLTELGQRFLRHALRVLEDLDEAADSIGGPGALPGAGRSGWVPCPAWVAGFAAGSGAGVPRHASGNPAWRWQTGMNRTLIDWLKADMLDLAIGRMDNPAVMEGLWFEMLSAEPLLLAVRKGHALAAAPPSLADVMAFPLVVPAQGSVPRHSAESLLARHGFVLPTGMLETSDAYLGQLTTLKSDAVWLAPRCSHAAGAGGRRTGAAAHLGPGQRGAGRTAAPGRPRARRGGRSLCARSAGTRRGAFPRAGAKGQGIVPPCPYISVASSTRLPAGAGHIGR
ncbi:LysR substrate-binding domain-containing protein [Cupriavidus basilensis]